MHPVEGLGYAEIFTHIFWQLLLLLVDLSHQLLSVIKVPSAEFGRLVLRNL